MVTHPVLKDQFAHFVLGIYFAGEMVSNLLTTVVYCLKFDLSLYYKIHLSQLDKPSSEPVMHKSTDACIYAWASLKCVNHKTSEICPN